MNRETKIQIWVLIICCMIFVYWLEAYHYDDCRRVGHTKLYCILDIFR